jgi:hypothetical protein
MRPPPVSPAPSAASPAPVGVLFTCALAWLVPGSGHFLHGQTQKALVFFLVLLTMFWIGVDSGGRLFSFQIADPLIGLAAVAQWALGLPRLVAAMAGWGPGIVVAATYEYGNTFLIVAGLLNMLIVLDAADLAAGRTRR